MQTRVLLDILCARFFRKGGNRGESPSRRRNTCNEEKFTGGVHKVDTQPIKETLALM